jgi:glycosyltransferase involved in cell wall biosynthesis
MSQMPAFGFNEPISIVVPNYNMGEYIQILVDSLIPAAEVVDEIIFVDDGSTDNSVKIISELQKSHALGFKIKIIDEGKNVGRFVAILDGVRAAKAKSVLISNVRTLYQEDSLKAGVEFKSRYTSVMPAVRFNEHKSIYNLYWGRTHQWIFRKHFEDWKKGFLITGDNFEDYVKGTGGFICDRDLFIEACENIPVQQPTSDDIFIMKYIAERGGTWVQDSYFIEWEPRQNLKEFMMRMWERGPGFVEYNLLHTKGYYWKIFVAVGVVTAALIVLSFYEPFALLGAVLLGFLAVGYQVVRFSKSFMEFLRLFPMHFLVVCFFSAGIIYGFFYALGWGRRPTPTGASKTL